MTKNKRKNSCKKFINQVKAKVKDGGLELIENIFQFSLKGRFFSINITYMKNN
jgi:hypothetical protein